MNEGSTRAWYGDALGRLRSTAGRRLTVATIAMVSAFAVVALFTSVDLADSDQTPSPYATVRVAAGGAVSPVPRSYLGLSTEYWALPLYARRLRMFEHVVSMLRVPGDGPLVLRIGGDSADHTFWDPRQRVLPYWAYAVTPQWTRLVSGLVRRERIRLILDLNLITGSPATAAVWASAAERSLPRGSIIGFEIGNEPDVYNHSAWWVKTDDEMVGDDALPRRLTRSDYVADFRQYADALHAVAPGVPLLGPALSNPRKHEGWTTALIASHEPSLGTITAHRYAYSGCTRHRSARFPTISRLLSQQAVTNLATSVASSVRAAHRAGLRFRLTELNSVNCGGRVGVSNTFATGLWAPNALFSLLHAHVDGVNLHVRADTINAPFAFNSAGLVARPLLYGMLLFRRALGSRPAFLPVRLRAASALDLDAWAVRSGARTLHVLLVNEGRWSVHVRLALPTAGPVSIQRLLAPSPRSRFGVTLDGQWLNHAGRWRGIPATETAPPTRRGYAVIVPRWSAALLGARLVAGALSRNFGATAGVRGDGIR